MNLKTDDRSEEELPAITPKQRAFVEALLKGKSASDGYREAYNCKNMSNAAVWVEASRLRANPKVSLWLRHCQRIGQDSARLTLEAHLAELARAREEAIACGQIRAGVQAEHYRGKAAGLYEHPLDVTSAPSDEELLTVIEETLGREMAEELRMALRGVSETH